MNYTKTIKTEDLFPELNRRLIELLTGLSPGEWDHPTLFPAWKVKDIAAHLLDTSIRRLSYQRDKYAGKTGKVITSYNELTKYIVEIADIWAGAFSRVSPEILIELIKKYQDQLAAFIKTLDPYETALFNVAWAGEERSSNWFDIAREYTERWHHQMQIRDVLNKPPLYEKHLYYPVLDCFMRALPYHYRGITKDEGYMLCVEITGKTCGRWFLARKNQSWTLLDKPAGTPSAIVRIECGAAWKIFVKWGNIEETTKSVEISGDAAFGRHILDMTCIMK